MIITFDGAVVFAMLLLLATFPGIIYRLAHGPGLADRVAALDLLAVVLMGLMFLHALRTGHDVALDVILVLAMVSFLGTIGFSRYLEERGHS